MKQYVSPFREAMFVTEETVPATLANGVIRGTLTAALATLAPDDAAPGGRPYASLVLVASHPDGRPLLLLSTLAEHTRNLTRDSRVSLLFDGTVGREEPLTGPRVTLQGQLERTDDPQVRARFLARHEEAIQYADFGDFAFYRLEPTRAHLVAGFGIIHWIPWSDMQTDITGAGELLEGEASILAHMNEDHADALAAMAGAAGAPPAAWHMTGCDPDGFDLRAGAQALRIRFRDRVTDLATVRAALVELARSARAG
jgi:putative heme iron utilization protein